MDSLLAYLPIVAAGFAIPQFLPQLRRVIAGETAGVSWAWAALTSLNNAAWFAYFYAAQYWMALVPALSATTFAGTLGVLLAARGRATSRPAFAAAVWGGVLASTFLIAGPGALGTMLTGAFVLQVTPSIWTAYRTRRPTGIARGTWLLVFGELSCWLIYGLYRADPRIAVLGGTGVTASVLMVLRTRPREGQALHVSRIADDMVAPPSIRAEHGASVSKRHWTIDAHSLPWPR